MVDNDVNNTHNPEIQGDQPHFEDSINDTRDEENDATPVHNRKYPRQVWEATPDDADDEHVVDAKAIKGQALADHLAENPMDGEYESLMTYFPDEEISLIGEDIGESYDGWRMFFDRVANFKGVGIGAALVSETGQHYPVLAYTSGPRGIGSKILPYLHHVQELRKRFTKTEFQHVPRVQNEFADALATLLSMIQHPNKNFINPIPVKIYDQPTYYAHVEKEVDGKPWFHDIKEYLAKGEYLELANAI
ncbi:uncharacterized protein [Nicotiana sylvestris]|uniref:uncharacterized protein n=1 Tax=Nicotiana sylvestris TaxID=4096 RepID=UPI00388C4CD8